jgi:hypothetical protein
MASAISEEKKSQNSSQSSFDVRADDICAHSNCIESNGILTCRECGLELSSAISNAPRIINGQVKAKVYG